MCVANEIDDDLDDDDRIYSFEELPEDAQEDVINKFGNQNLDNWDPRDDLNEYWKDQLSENGFNNAEFNWCIGSYNGSDEVCFKASIDERYFIDKFKKHLRKDRSKTYALRRRQRKLLEFADNNDLVAFAIYDKGYRDKHFKHSRYIEFTGDENYNYSDLIEDKADDEFRCICLEAIYGDEEEFNVLMEEMKEFIEAERMEWCEKIYDSLYEDYEYQFSKECIMDLIEANEYKFYRDGEVVRRIHASQQTQGQET